MDVDRLTTEEREQHWAENRCFGCHKVGHRVKDCQSKQQATKPSEEKAVVKYKGKKTANTAREMIRNLVADMEKEEKDKLFENMMTNEDF